MLLLVATSVLAVLALVTAVVTLMLNLRMHSRLLPHAEMRREFEALSQQVSDLADFTERRERRERVRKMRDGHEKDAPAAPQSVAELKAQLRRQIRGNSITPP
jgi:hypothetical protein